MQIIYNCAHLLAQHENSKKTFSNAYVITPDTISKSRCQVIHNDESDSKAIIQC